MSSAAIQTEENPYEGLCPKCGSPLTDVQKTKSGKEFIRCTMGFWNSETKQAEGCDFIQWKDARPQYLKENCPKCGARLVMAKTKTGKQMKKCATAGWDREAKKPTGCNYIEWVDESRKKLNETCPKCNNVLILQTTASGKKLKKCSTSRWDREKKEATGCTYIQWMPDESTGGEEANPFD